MSNPEILQNSGPGGPSSPGPEQTLNTQLTGVQDALNTGNTAGALQELDQAVRSFNPSVLNPTMRGQIVTAYEQIQKRVNTPEAGQTPEARAELLKNFRVLEERMVEKGLRSRLRVLTGQVVDSSLESADKLRKNAEQWAKENPEAARIAVGGAIAAGALAAIMVVPRFLRWMGEKIGSAASWAVGIVGTTAAAAVTAAYVPQIRELVGRFLPSLSAATETPEQQAKKKEEEEKKKKEGEGKGKLDGEAKIKSDADAKAKLDAQIKAKADADAIQKANKEQLTKVLAEIPPGGSIDFSDPRLGGTNLTNGVNLLQLTGRTLTLNGQSIRFEQRSDTMGSYYIVNIGGRNMTMNTTGLLGMNVGRLLATSQKVTIDGRAFLRNAGSVGNPIFIPEASLGAVLTSMTTAPVPALPAQRDFEIYTKRSNTANDPTDIVVNGQRFKKETKAISFQAV